MTLQSGVRLAIQVLAHGKGMSLPAYQSLQAAGMDLMAALSDPDEIALAPNERILIPTGLIMAIPEGYEGQVRSRSGLAAQQGITVLNAPGTLDADYRGEVKVLLINHGQEPATIKRGDRIAQLIIAPVMQAQVVIQDILPDTERGAGGFGSTGA